MISFLFRVMFLVWSPSQSSAPLTWLLLGSTGSPFKLWFFWAHEAKTFGKWKKLNKNYTQTTWEFLYTASWVIFSRVFSTTIAVLKTISTRGEHGTSKKLTLDISKFTAGFIYSCRLLVQEIISGELAIIFQETTVFRGLQTFGEIHEICRHIDTEYW